MKIAQTWRTQEYRGYTDSRGTLVPVDPPPFEVKRLYWIYGAPERTDRGNHAHRQCHQFFFCLAGSSFWFLEDPEGAHWLSLDDPQVGLYVPPMTWHSFTMEPGTVLLSLASTPYQEADYIRSYSEWKSALRPRP